MEIKKIENCDYVMLPRLQRPGLKPEHVERDAFKAELRHVEGRGDFWLLFQQSKPHLVAHVQLPKSEAEFDQIANISRTICPSSASSQALMQKNSPPSILTSSKSVSLPSMMPQDGGMSMVRSFFLKLCVKMCPAENNYKDYYYLCMLKK